MRFHLKNQSEVDSAAEYLATLAGREAVVDIKRVSYKRSLQANRFYHVMLSYFGTQVGCTIEESKQIIRIQQPDLYQVKWKQIGEISVMISRSSADFTSKEMADSIDRFRQWSREVANIDIPAPDDAELLKFMDDVIAQHEGYL